MIYEGSLLNLSWIFPALNWLISNEIAEINWLKLFFIKKFCFCVIYIHLEYNNETLFWQMQMGYVLYIHLATSLSSRGLGHRPFTAVTGVRIPVGTPYLDLIRSTLIHNYYYFIADLQFFTTIARFIPELINAYALISEWCFASGQFCAFKTRYEYSTSGYDFAWRRNRDWPIFRIGWSHCTNGACRCHYFLFPRRDHCIYGHAVFRGTCCSYAWVWLIWRLCQTLYRTRYRLYHHMAVLTNVVGHARNRVYSCCTAHAGVVSR